MHDHLSSPGNDIQVMKSMAIKGLERMLLIQIQMTIRAIKIHLQRNYIANDI